MRNAPDIGWRRVLDGALLYAGATGLGLFLFLAENHLTRPSGLGIAFGPINYLHLIFAFGVSVPGIAIYAMMYLGFVVLWSLYPRCPALVLCGAGLYVLAWFALGFLAAVYECEGPFECLQQEGMWLDMW